MSQIKILLVDDHNIIINGLRSLLEDVDDIIVVSHATNGHKALEIVKSVTVDVVLMDIDMPGMNGIEATKIMKEQYPHIKILILTVHHENSFIRNLMLAGADGYLLKNLSKDDLINAIKKIYNGHKYFSSDITMSLLNSNPEKQDKPIQFTLREMDVLMLLIDGLTNKEIGKTLFISHKTVDKHRTSLMKKAGVNNIAGLVKFAIKNGYTD